LCAAERFGNDFDDHLTKKGNSKMRPGFWQVLIVIAVVAILFGAKKIPELARSIGKAKGEFKKGLADGEKAEKEAEKESECAKEIEGA
jgi:sec-independent protein translocase protein TatA